ncbi:MAG: transcriptional regulator NrdR [Candidatus Komeilibacteria bacterium CG_4_10_14_0_2_um_filter_37_10]|uniref:Transcriptional repressor NrdR n=1 Tax=Candidatus Komeilibacteria bacterium CG_4_10_14_0_2_um_filter_37_10 TaxID=1974470 RepID=A0A2M7VDH7_9BACT|nr:MAG: transcriptional regulator NrdR [Candidatus Komeilibacteria bacterium CG_4_10_14_0_2_um_filter_37_10]
MHCPICLSKNTKVLDSRLVADGLAIRRRRECERCNYRFSTYEEMEILNLTVIKRDGRRESYSQEKLIKGIKRALEKRPYTQDAFKKLISQMERDIQKKRKDEITSSDLGEIVVRHLKKFDQIAYVRFASVYYSFSDLTSFQKAVSNLIIKKQKSKKK